jgi:hypothetical protein
VKPPLVEAAMSGMLLAILDQATELFLFGTETSGL